MKPNFSENHNRNFQPKKIIIAYKIQSKIKDISIIFLVKIK